MGTREDVERYKAQMRERNRELDRLDAASPISRKQDDAMDAANASTKAVEPSRSTTMKYGELRSAKKRKKAHDEAIGEISQSAAVVPATSSDTQSIIKGPESKSSFAPPRKGPRNKMLAGYKTKQIVNTRTTNKLSDWYENINMNEKWSRSDLQRVMYTMEIIKNSVVAMQGGDEGEIDKSVFDLLRKEIHGMEFYPFLSAIIIKKSKILQPEGLPRIFDNDEDVTFPWDIQADARALYQRWIIGDIDSHLLRGIDTTKGKLKSGMKRTSHTLIENYEFKRSANCVGENGLVNGQWWPSRLCALRDGAHGEHEAGIHGKTGRGAFSVVVAFAQGGYDDQDKGAFIEYCGTESTTPIPTKSTKLMLEARDTKQQIRVLRAENKTSKFAPKKGLRYDGLYTITGSEILREKTAMYRFTLRRCKGQDPIRYDGPEARPTGEELRNYAAIREYLGMVAV